MVGVVPPPYLSQFSTVPEGAGDGARDLAGDLAARRVDGPFDLPLAPLGGPLRSALATPGLSDGLALQTLGLPLTPSCLAGGLLLQGLLRGGVDLGLLLGGVNGLGGLGVGLDPLGQ